MPMSDFFQLVLYVFMEAMIPAAACMVIGTAVWLKLTEKRHPGKKAPLRKAIPLALFLAYLGGLFSLTLFQRATGSPGIQSHLFRSFWEAWNHFDLHFWGLFLGNIAMFLPLGVLLPLIAKSFRRWYVTIPTGFGVSLLIETVQLVFQLGSADVDDLFCNTLGNALGYCLCMVGLSVWEKKPARGATYGALPLLAAIGLAGVFLVYETQPYGNLMEGPSFVADTSGMEWVLDCDLSQEPREMDVYFAQPFDHAGALAFAQEFAQEHGKVIDEIMNYDDTIWVRNPVYGETGFRLSVTLADRTFSYRDLKYEYYNSISAEERYLPDDGQRTLEELRTALLEYGIMIPERATLTHDGDSDPTAQGWYTIQLNQIIEGNTLLDGTIRCKVLTHCALEEIYNGMTVSTRIGTEVILSEAEAYQRLREGRFSNGSRFEYVAREMAPSEIHVLSCELEYLTDTKGYRQPVYYFELAEVGPVFVPALRDYRGP